MGGGFAGTEYQLDGGEWTSGLSVTVLAPGDHSGDGSHTVSYRSSDAAGNLEEAQSVTVKIDTLGPNTAGRSASARKGSAVSLRYYLADTLSSQTTAVKVVVKDSRGGTVVSSSLGARWGATWYSLRWTPKARGASRYYVYGKDLAGNAQVAVGSAKVTVR
jgi:hypothetical protein